MNRIMFSGDAVRPLLSRESPRTVFPELPPGSRTGATLSRLVFSWSTLLDRTDTQIGDIRSGVRHLATRLRAADGDVAGDLRGDDGA
ncbi:hypothetical protein OS125_10620 [Corynebacterium sp. P7003]|uniref:Uncharacterized protein n=1 Tax=Corynebacterium pygosceleis TaxID=2800406 RepID=A0ABT3WXZ3_9CORY|nr:hypothetical protein [Corynebacterium pygosceleis]MCX7445687.1 hypothetical protein [Corynebacterium pygosceleis]